MKKNDIPEIVKEVSKHLYGYNFNDCSLKNDAGLEFYFFRDWNNKEKILARGAYEAFSIGCSFNKDPKKIANDIKKRLLPKYRESFFRKIKDNLKRSEDQKRSKLLLESISKNLRSQVISRNNYSDANENLYIEGPYFEVFENYRGLYEFKLELNYKDALLLSRVLGEKLD